MSNRNLVLAVASVCVAALVGVSAGQGTSHTLTVKVFRDGDITHVVDGVNVCLGTQQKITAAAGTVTFAVPTATTVHIIAFRSGFIGVDRTHLMGGYDQTVNIGLQVGSGGPTCGTPAVSGVAPVVSNFRINGGVATTPNPEVALNFAWVGMPLTMRHALSEAALNTAAWRTFQRDPLVAIGGSGPATYTVFFQIRDSTGRISPTVSDSIQLLGRTGTPPPTTTTTTIAPTDTFGWDLPDITQAEATRYTLPSPAVNSDVAHIVHGSVVVRTDGNACTFCHHANATPPDLTAISRTDWCSRVTAFAAVSNKPANLKNFFNSWRARNCP
jgi:hypothetical protein